MKVPLIKAVRCAIYTRVSTDHGLDQEFNSLDAQYDAASAYIKSQAHAGWTLIRSRYDDGGYSGGSTDRPDLQRLLDDIRARKLDVIVVYKVDRLTRSLADFAKLVESVRSITRTRSCLASNRQSWIAHYSMRSSKSSRINGPPDLSRETRATIC
jgi:predicted site-specific integrase-resolvase